MPWVISEPPTNHMATVTRGRSCTPTPILQTYDKVLPLKGGIIVKCVTQFTTSKLGS